MEKPDQPDERRRAIVVEADAVIRRLQSVVLRQHAGMAEVVEYATVIEALPSFSTEHFDFVMLDVSRPGGDLKEFLHISSKKQKSPVIAFTTGEVSRTTLELLVSDHVFAVFPKPFDVHEVAKSVRAGMEAAAAGTLYPTFFGYVQKLFEHK